MGMRSVLIRSQNLSENVYREGDYEKKNRIKKNSEGVDGESKINHVIFFTNVNRM